MYCLQFGVMSSRSSRRSSDWKYSNNEKSHCSSGLEVSHWMWTGRGNITWNYLYLKFDNTIRIQVSLAWPHIKINCNLMDDSLSPYIASNVNTKCDIAHKLSEVCRRISEVPSLFAYNLWFSWFPVMYPLCDLLVSAPWNNDPLRLICTSSIFQGVCRFASTSPDAGATSGRRSDTSHSGQLSIIVNNWIC